MIQLSSEHYDMLKKTNEYFPLGEDICLKDHLNGFDTNLKNLVLDALVERGCTNSIYLQYVLTPELKHRYKSIDINFSANLQNSINFNKHAQYTIHPALDYKNFICSFNGSLHVSRKLLVAILEKFQYFNPAYCSKNFSFSVESLDGHIQEHIDNDNGFYNKFFIGSASEEFFQTINSFGHIRYDHGANIYNLEHKLTQSFLHIVSETFATSYYPFVTEKFLYSIVTRGLFLSYAQPGWHTHLEKYYGFKRYTKLFDYQFDAIQNPVVRLVELMTMVSKFSTLSSDDWHSLYQLQQDEIEYNYHHYFSKNYLKCLERFI
jgi:hypothetical protein